MSSDLVEKLRDQSKSAVNRNWELCLAAADEIDRLRAELLEAQRGMWPGESTEIERLRAEVAAALEWARSFKKLMTELPILDCPESHQALKEQK